MFPCVSWIYGTTPKETAPSLKQSRRVPQFGSCLGGVSGFRTIGSSTQVTFFFFALGLIFETGFYGHKNVLCFTLQYDRVSLPLGPPVSRKTPSYPAVCLAFKKLLPRSLRIHVCAVVILASKL